MVASELPLDATQRTLARYLARRYYVTTAATERAVWAAHRAAEEVGLDPLLVLALIAVESRFNLIPHYHDDKLREVGDEDAVLDPESNIQLGARILQEYVRYAERIMAERARLVAIVDADPL